jgi:hypothetical protein
MRSEQEAMDGARARQASLHQKHSEYYNRMDFPMEAIATAMWGIDRPESLRDHEIAEIAARKIVMLKKMILATGFNENMLKIMMEDC